MQDSDIILFSRHKLILKFIERIYKQGNMRAISDGEKVKVPAHRFTDFVHDLSIILGKTVADVIIEMDEEMEEQG